MPSQPSTCFSVLPASPRTVHWRKEERIVFLRGLDCCGLGKKYFNSIFRWFGLRNVAKCFMNAETETNPGVLSFKTWEWDKGVPSKKVSELRLTLKYFYYKLTPIDSLCTLQKKPFPALTLGAMHWLSQIFFFFKLAPAPFPLQLYDLYRPN